MPPLARTRIAPRVGTAACTSPTSAAGPITTGSWSGRRGSRRESRASISTISRPSGSGTRLSLSTSSTLASAGRTTPASPPPQATSENSSGIITPLRLITTINLPGARILDADAEE